MSLNIISRESLSHQMKSKTQWRINFQFLHHSQDTVETESMKKKQKKTLPYFLEKSKLSIFNDKK